MVDSGTWQRYIDVSLIGTGHISQAAIAGTDGSLYAHSARFKPSPDELLALVNLFKNFLDSDVFTEEFTLAGTKYLTIVIDFRYTYEKNLMYTCGRIGKTGAVIFKTTQVILIGIYDETQTPGNATTTVGMLGDYLLGQERRY